jgi:hypothetical protein
MESGQRSRRRSNSRSNVIATLVVGLKLLSFVALAACATVSTRNQYTVVQSKPSGALISTTPNRDGLLGQTPLVVRTPSASTIKLYALFGDDQARKMGSKCSFAWGDLVLGNLPVAAALGPALGGLYYGLALGTDLLTESAFDCPSRIDVDLSAKQLSLSERIAPKRRESCRIIAAVAPYHFLRSVSDASFEEWRSEVRKQLQPCDVILPLSVTRESLASIGLTFDRPSHLRSIQRSELNRFALATGATHLADIDVTKVSEDSDTQYVTTIYDLYTLASSRLSPVRAASLKDSSFYDPLQQTLDSTFMVIPNAIQMATLFGFPHFDQSQASYKFFRHDEERDYKSILANWEISSVPRPSNFGVVSPKFISSVALWSQLLQRQLNMYWRYSNVNPSDDRYSLKSVLNIWYVGLTSENRFYLMFGKYGAPFVGVGAGMSYVRGSVADADYSVFTPIVSSYGGYLVETSERSFLEVSGGLSFTASDHYQSRFTNLRQFDFIKVKAGFLLPVLRNKLRGAL